jgi:holin-like protein
MYNKYIKTNKDGDKMKTLKQLGIIITILLVGQILQQHFNLPIPGTVMGMIILLVLLLLKILKLQWVEKISSILLEHLSFLFVPAGVGILTSLDKFKGKVIPLFIVVMVSTIVVMVVTGVTVQLLIKNKKGEKI